MARSARRWSAKNGGDQALGRFRGGWGTKFHAATLDENCAVALHLTAGQAHDGRQFEALYESLPAGDSPSMASKPSFHQ